MTEGIPTSVLRSTINPSRFLLLLVLFLLPPSANAQAVRDREIATNVALASNGATATASSTYPDGRFNVASVIDGDRGSAWGVPQHPGWSDATNSRYPDWVQVDFSGFKTINIINVFTLQDDDRLGQPITKTETFSQWGIQNFTVQCRQSGSWVTIPNGLVMSNNRVWREFTFSPITTDAIRVIVTKSLAYPLFYSRIQEVEAWEAVNTPPSYQVGVNYHSTSSEFASDNFIRDYHDPAVRSRVREQLRGMAEAGADVLKLFMWFVGRQEYYPAERWRLAFPVSSQEVANLEQYLTDVAPLTNRNGQPISVSLTFAWHGCANYQQMLGRTFGQCNLSWSQLTGQAKQTVDSALQVAGAVRRPDGSRVVSTVYLEAEVMIGAKPNEDQFLREVYPYFVQQAQAAGVLPSLYFLIEAHDQTVVDEWFVDDQYPILNGHRPLYWVYRSIDFLQREGLPVPERLDVSIYPEANAISYDESLRRIFDDIAEVFPGKRVAVVETYYPVDQAERRRLGQGYLAEYQRRGLLDAVIFWTTPNAGRNGEGVGYPFDFDSYRCFLSSSWISAPTLAERVEVMTRNAGAVSVPVGARVSALEGINGAIISVIGCLAISILASETMPRSALLPPFPLKRKSKRSSRLKWPVTSSVRLSSRMRSRLIRARMITSEPNAGPATYCPSGPITPLPPLRMNSFSSPAPATSSSRGRSLRRIIPPAATTKQRPSKA
jgi:hypothetical protein